VSARWLEELGAPCVPAFARLAPEPRHAPPRGDDVCPTPARQGAAPTEQRPGSPAGSVPAFAACLFLACARPAPVPVPDVAAQASVVAARVELRAAADAELLRAARRLDAAERAAVLASSPRERRAARAAWLDARHQLRALAREEK
jgi:hypothetical protein